MALTNCPECQLQVSDKAYTCPHCGYPLQADKSHSKSRKAVKRRMRLPNGFGQISFIKNCNLRKPYRAMVSIGTNATTGRPIVKPLKPVAYFETYNDAYAALIEYNRNPYDLDMSMTMQDLYERWSEEHFKTVSNAFKKWVKSTWKYSDDIKNMKVSEVRSRHLKGVINSIPYDSTKYKMKTILNLMYKHALEYEIVDKNYAAMFSLEKSVQSNLRNSSDTHKAFNQEELKLLWDNKDLPWVSPILIQCYMGWRPTELCLLEVKNVDLENWLITGGIKTEAGSNRVVPIHEKIKVLVKKEFDRSKELNNRYLISYTDDQNSLMEFNYYKYRYRFDKVMKEINMPRKHKLHDPRKTFITMLKLGKADEYAIKLMAGHEIADVTESVYTERSIDFLREELSKLDENIM